jgi:bifunctional ADP-heptose synthase (sugar kinase/adenylyltransferase)
MLNKKVLVIGDTIIDEYIYVRALGKPSKENIIASLYDYKQLFLGGLFASVSNIASFCNNVDFLTMMGNGKKDFQFIKKNIPKNVKERKIYKNKLPTTKKTRYIEKTHSDLKKLYEVYEMMDDPLSKNNEKKIFNYLNRNLSKYDLVIVNDYGHGLLTKKIINIICKKSNFLAVNVQINAGNKGYNLITKYKGASYYCIDIDEARFALQNKYIKAKEIPKSILKITKGDNIAITMGHKGSVSNLTKNKIFYMPTFTNVVVDTMSAGDSYFVMSSMLFYLSKSVELSSLAGNLGGAITVGVSGCVPVEKTKFFETLNTLFKT